MSSQPWILTNQDLSWVADPVSNGRKQTKGLTPCYPGGEFERLRIEQLHDDGYVHTNIVPGSSFCCEVSSKTFVKVPEANRSMAEREYAKNRAFNRDYPGVDPEQVEIDEYWDEVALSEAAERRGTPFERHIVGQSIRMLVSEDESLPTPETRKQRRKVKNKYTHGLRA